jgi:hypothetical protein
VWWQRALQKDFDAKAVLPLFMDIIRHMLRAKPTTVTGQEISSGHSGARAQRANPESRNNSSTALDSGSAPDGASRNDSNGKESGR